VAVTYDVGVNVYLLLLLLLLAAADNAGSGYLQFVSACLVCSLLCPRHQSWGRKRKLLSVRPFVPCL